MIKGRIILYGWVISLALLIIGLTAMEIAMETGKPMFILGLLMISVFAWFCYMVIHNQHEVDRAYDEFERFIDSFGKKDKA